MSDEPTWRVYLREWLAVYTSDAPGPRGRQECEAVFARRHEGRVRPGDARIRAASPERPDRPAQQVLQLRLPNLRGEFKDRADAGRLAGEIAAGSPHGGAGPRISIVRRGSGEERELLDYGKKMLPDAGRGGEKS